VRGSGEDRQIAGDAGRQGGAPVGTLEAWGGGALDGAMEEAERAEGCSANHYLLTGGTDRNFS
jgi:hypothetical protein